MNKDEGPLQFDEGLLCGLRGALCRVSANSSSFVGPDEKTDLNERYHSQDAGKEDKGTREEGDRFIRRRTPEGFLAFLCGLFLASVSGTAALLWALGWLPSSRPGKANGQP